jgi:hypothetical protein
MLPRIEKILSAAYNMFLDDHTRYGTIINRPCSWRFTRIELCLSAASMIFIHDPNTITWHTILNSLSVPIPAHRTISIRGKHLFDKEYMPSIS